MSGVTKFVDERVTGETKSSNVHYIPAKIEFDGKAEIQQNFIDTIQKQENTNELRTEFRGRPFRGTSLVIADGYKGMVADNLSSSTSSIKSKERDGVLYIKKEFDNLTYWNWDKTPSGMDPSVKLMDWLELANVLHEPVNGEADK